MKNASQVCAPLRQTRITVAILVDLQGPKIRIGRFLNKKIILQKVRNLRLMLKWMKIMVRNNASQLGYKNLPNDVH